MAKRNKAATKAKASNAKSKPRSQLGKERKKPFQLEEATIDDLHHAIQNGTTTVVAVVQHYIERVRKYNGVASVLVTKDGEPVAEAKGTVRGQAPWQFPTESLKVADILPNLDKYRGPPLEFGRMEATASDPTVQQQFGMIAGIKNGTQLNALAIRTGQVPDIRDKLLAQGAEPQTLTPEQVGAYARNEITKWGKVVKEAGIKAE